MRQLRKSDFRIMGMTMLYDTLIFMVLRASGLIVTSWIVVFCPIWVPVLFIAVFILMDKIATFIMEGENSRG